jgi:hypothetical protein
MMMMSTEEKVRRRYSFPYLPSSFIDGGYASFTVSWTDGRNGHQTNGIRSKLPFGHSVASGMDGARRGTSMTINGEAWYAHRF